ncbi:hypothetical protein FisN_4Lh130 [Fistulifera solaris]|uniref:C-CAP/cofactor C-like domain-containing protein n=1 Tax=Fistulifera solaris TaxID=1519565 RepID=A0A1Z5JZ53_FISSO|nr:hypothetical protein FisN_4Lh130 [Fistulifera solaris]|eukprot:GAX19294.1 hypothetical protein FisN_4Lh130 [Fistulifera solaris]
MDGEALFLKSRREREESRTQRHLRTQKIQEKRQLALELLKERLKEWNSELDHIVGTASTSSEEEKRILRIRFATHDDRLTLLRKECLSTDSLSSLLQVLDHHSDNIDGCLHDEDESLTVPDFGFFHSQFSACQSRLDRCRKEKLPRGKFIFKRYRQALENSDQALERSEASKKDKAKAPTESQSKRFDPSRTLSDIQNLDGVIVHGNGLVEGVDGHQLTSNLTSFALHNITNCKIVLRGFYQSIHLLSVSESSIIIENNVDGAIHATECHHMTLRSTCQQLRLHGSTGLDCYVFFKGGAILEDCSRINFWKRRDTSMGDVRDFNWLKNGVPSPNFVVDEENNEDMFDVEKNEADSDQTNETIQQEDTVAFQDKSIESLSMAEKDIQTTLNTQDDEDEL